MVFATHELVHAKQEQVSAVVHTLVPLVPLANKAIKLQRRCANLLQFEANESITLMVTHTHTHHTHNTHHTHSYTLMHTFVEWRVVKLKCIN